MVAVLKPMNRDNITVRGFRSTFRDWASQQTNFPDETCERALAHRISEQAGAAHGRRDRFEKRPKLTEVWRPPADATPMVKML